MLSRYENKQTDEHQVILSDHGFYRAKRQLTTEELTREAQKRWGDGNLERVGRNLWRFISATRKVTE